MMTSVTGTSVKDDLARSSVTRFYLSTNSAPNDTWGTTPDERALARGDRLLGVREVLGLRSNETSFGVTTITLPSETPAGVYLIVACADDLDAVVEHNNEINNCTPTETITVVAGRIAD